jgi:hypothetical protein
VMVRRGVACSVAGRKCGVFVDGLLIEPEYFLTFSSFNHLRAFWTTYLVPSACLRLEFQN